MDPDDGDKQFLCGVLERFQDEIINDLNAPDVINGIQGLSEPDVAEIIAEDGHRRRNEKLLTIILSRDLNTLISFIKQLRGNSIDIYDKIYEEIQNNRPLLIDRLFQRRRPTASAIPQRQVTHTPDNNDQNILSEPGKRVCLDQETHKYVIKRIITEGTPLDDVPNRLIKKWADWLNVSNSWGILADTLLLTRKEVRDLERGRNPGMTILDLMCEEHAWTVQGLLHYLACAELEEIRQAISDTLGREITAGVLSSAVDSNRGMDCRENREYRSEAAIASPQPMTSNPNESPVVSCISTTQNRVPWQRMQETTVNTSERSASFCLSTASRNEVPEQQIQETTVNTSEPSASFSSSTASRNEVPEQQIQETTVNTSESSASSCISTAPPNQVPKQRIQETVTESKKSDAETQTASQIQVEDTSDNYEKNYEQEMAASVRDRENQINWDSFRDIRNSLPSTPVSNQVFDSASLQYETRNDTNIRANSTNNNNNEQQPSDDNDDTHPKDVV